MTMRWMFVFVVAAAAALVLRSNSGAGDAKTTTKKAEASKALTVNGELSDSDPKDKVRTNSFCKTYTFKMIKGRTYQIDMKSTDIDSYLRLENPAGEQVAKDDDSGGFPDARIIYKAEETGDFKIIATTFGGGSTGKFALTARDKDMAVAGKGPIDLKNEKGKADFTGSLEKDDPLYKGKTHKLFTFNMEAGKTYQIDMKSKAIDSYLFLESPDGKLLAMDDDGGDGLDARIIYKAAATGKHRIVCTNFGGRLGEFTLSIRQSDD